MSMHKRIKYISIGLLICAVFIQIIVLTCYMGWNDKLQVLSFISLLMGTIGSIASFFIPSSYVCYISPEDWVKGESGWTFSVHARRHGIGKHPKVVVYERDPSGYLNLVLTTINVNPNGDVNIVVGIQINKNLEVVIA